MSTMDCSPSRKHGSSTVPLSRLRWVFALSGCVRASALDAMQYGFVPLVVRDACADRHETPHEANLFDLQAKYAEVISEAEALAVIARAA
jgi:maleamate amidohydrolase